MTITLKSLPAKQVLHRAGTRGVVITGTQIVETWQADKLVKREQHRTWRNWVTQAFSHMDTVEV